MISYQKFGGAALGGQTMHSTPVLNLRVSIESSPTSLTAGEEIHGSDSHTTHQLCAATVTVTYYVLALYITGPVKRPRLLILPAPEPHPYPTLLAC